MLKWCKRGLLNYFCCLFADWLQHARQIWTEINHFLYQKFIKKSLFYQKIYWILTFSEAWKLFHFRKGLTNCLFYILSFFEKHKVIYQKSGLTGHYSNIIHVYIRNLPPNVFESIIHFIHSLYLSTV